MARKKGPLPTAALSGELSPAFSDNLRSLNPWWTNQPGPELPTFRRWPFDRLSKLIRHGMTPATVLRGPRRVGKTVLLRQLIDFLLADGVAPEAHTLRAIR